MKLNFGLGQRPFEELTDSDAPDQLYGGGFLPLVTAGARRGGLAGVGALLVRDAVMELTEARAPGALNSASTPLVTRRNGVSGLRGTFDDEGWGEPLYPYNVTYDDFGNVIGGGETPIYAAGTPAADKTQAAVIAAASPGTPVAIAGTNERVIAVNSAPATNPDPNTWYKVGQMLMRATGQIATNGAPLYTSIPAQGGVMGMSPMTLALLAGAAFLLVK